MATFPDFGPIADSVAMTFNGYGQAWMIFQMVGGFMPSSALYYIALIGTLIGGLSLLYFKNQQSLKNVICWLLIVLILLVAPYKSTLFFYPLAVSKSGEAEGDVIEENYQEFSELMRRNIRNSIAMVPTAEGERGEALKTFYAFTPQLVATHVMSLLHRALFTTMFTTSFDASGEVRVRDFVNDLISAGEFANIPSAQITDHSVGREVYYFSQLCSESPRILLKEPYDPSPIYQSNNSMSPLFSDDMLSADEHARLRSTIFKAGKVLKLQRDFFEMSEDSGRVGYIPPVAMVYSAEDFDALLNNYFSSDENMKKKLKDDYIKAFDTSGLRNTENTGASGLDAVINFISGSDNCSMSKAATLAKPNEVNDDACIWYRSPLDDDENTARIFFGLGKYSSSSGEYRIDPDSVAIQFRELNFHRTRKSVNEDQAEVINNEDIGRMPVALGLLQPVPAYRVPHNKRDEVGRVLETVDRTAVGPDSSRIFNSVDGYQINFDDAIVGVGTAAVDCAQLHRKIREHALYDMFSNMEYSIPFITKMVGDKVYANTPAAFLGSGAPDPDKKAHITVDDFFFSARDGAKAAVAEAKIRNSNEYGNITLDESQLNEKARLTVVNTLLNSALNRSEATRQPYVMGLAGTLSLDYNISNQYENSIFTKAGGIGPFMGNVGKSIAEAVLGIGAWFIGARAIAYLAFIKYLIGLAEMFVLMVTPVIMMVGLFSPALAPRMLIAPIAMIAVIKTVPITFTLVDGLLHMMYYLANNTFSLEAEVQKNMIIWAGATLYTGLIGLTLMLLPSFISGAAGPLQKLDGAAEKLADSSVGLAEKIGKTVAITAAAMVTAGAAGAAGATKAAMVSKAAAGAAGGGNDAPPQDEAQTPEIPAGDEEQNPVDGQPEQPDVHDAAFNDADEDAAEGQEQANEQENNNAPKSAFQSGAEMAKKMMGDSAGSGWQRAGIVGAVAWKQAAQVLTRSASNVPFISDVLREANPAGAYREGTAMAQHMQKVGGVGAYNELESAAKMKDAYDAELGLAQKGTAGKRLMENGGSGYWASLENTSGAADSAANANMAKFRAGQEAGEAYKQLTGDKNASLSNLHEENILLASERAGAGAFLAQVRAQEEMGTPTVAQNAMSKQQSQRDAIAATQAAAEVFAKGGYSVGGTRNLAIEAANEQLRGWSQKVESIQVYAQTKALERVGKNDPTFSKLNGQLQEINTQRKAIENISLQSVQQEITNAQEALNNGNNQLFNKLKSELGEVGIDISAKGMPSIDTNGLQSLASMRQTNLQTKARNIQADLDGRTADLMQSNDYKAELSRLLGKSGGLTAEGAAELSKSIQGDVKWAAAKRGTELAYRHATDQALADDFTMLKGSQLEQRVKRGETLFATEQAIYDKYQENWRKGRTSVQQIARVASSLEAAPEKSAMWSKVEGLKELEVRGMDWHKRNLGATYQMVGGYMGAASYGKLANLDANVSSGVLKGMQTALQESAGHTFRMDLIADRRGLELSAKGLATSAWEKEQAAQLKAIEGGAPTKDVVVVTKNGPQNMDGAWDTLAGALGNVYTEELRKAANAGDGIYKDKITGAEYKLRDSFGHYDQTAAKEVQRRLGRRNIAPMAEIMNSELKQKLFKSKDPVTYVNSDGKTVIGYRFDKDNLKIVMERTGFTKDQVDNFVAKHTDANGNLSLQLYEPDAEDLRHMNMKKAGNEKVKSEPSKTNYANMIRNRSNRGRMS